ncbi:Endonuclease/exonuclease/phosphatase [Mycena sp. CBHHK59/15]|nr:Endonuclease/exonuclease/phosphatase [Mycena sp. CBHHK59/15]
MDHDNVTSPHSTRESARVTVNVNCTSLDVPRATCNTIVNGDQNVSVRCWNVDGRLAANMSQPEFLKGLESYDINFFQETHLYPGQEETLPLPDGYDVFAVAREPSLTFNKQYGGVAAIFRKSLHIELDEELSGPDLLVLRIGSVSIFCSYVLPHGSAWEEWAAIHPMDKLAQSLAVARERGDSIFVIGDLNARTGSRQVSKDHPPRFSLDATVNTQGQSMLRMAGDYDLRIMNGDLRFGNGSWGWTFCQKRKTLVCKSVIDYATCNLSASLMVQSFDICTIGPWSDHAPLVLNLCVPAIPMSINPGKSYIHEKRKAAEESNGFLDSLLHDSLAAKKSPDEKLNAFYGPVFDISSTLVKVYTDGSCIGNGKGSARAGAGTYAGPQSSLNASLA